MSELERRKWDAYYDSAPLNEEDESTRQFNAEFVERVSALLPPGSKTLEAGCGGGWQSLALARSGRFEVSLMDFSPKALEYSRRVFAREGVTAEFLQGDIQRIRGPCGVRSRCSTLLRAGYITRSKSSPRCCGQWPAGRSATFWRSSPTRFATGIGCGGSRKMASGMIGHSTRKLPLADLSALFQSAYLQFCGQVFLGGSWSEAFIRGLPGMDPELSSRILEIHRQAVVPLAQRSYLIAALGCVSAGEPPLPGWTPPPAPERIDLAETRALAADSLTLRIGGEMQLAAERRQWEAAFAAEREVEIRFMLEVERSRARSAGWAAGAGVSACGGAGTFSRLRCEPSLDRLESARADELERLESLRRRVWTGLREFRAQFEKQLAVYKSQKAWQAMLLIRKAYTLLGRRRMRGLLPLLELREFELSFPDALDYVPPMPWTKLPAGRFRPSLRPRPIAATMSWCCPSPISNSRFQRPQQIAAQFARAGHRVFWISPARLLPASSRSPYETVPIRENLWEVRLAAEAFDLYRGALEPSQTAALLDGLSRLYRDLDIAASCAILQFPFWRQIGLGLRERFGAKVVYDCMDDWQNWPVEPLPGAFSLSEERKLVRESDVLVVTSRELRDRHAAGGVGSELIPNAADFEFFHDAPASSPLSGLARPVIGYYGAIADWFDLELMTQVAKSRPQYSFVLIGEVHMLDVSALAALPNVRLLGEKHYRELPGYLREFDVCTLPFRMNRLTKAVDPVKMYEYFSQGKPVVLGFRCRSWLPWRSCSISREGPGGVRRSRSICAARRAGRLARPEANRIRVRRIRGGGGSRR